MSSCREGTEARLATLRKSVSRMRARKCNVLLGAHLVAFIEKLSHSIAMEVVCADDDYVVESREAQ